MPHKRDILELVIVWLQSHGEKLFWLTVGGAVSVYMSARQKEGLTKVRAFGLFCVSLAVGFWTFKLAELMGAGEYAFLIGAGVTSFASPILETTYKEVPTTIKKLLSWLTDKVTK